MANLSRQFRLLALLRHGEVRERRRLSTPKRIYRISTIRRSSRTTIRSHCFVGRKKPGRVTSGRLRWMSTTCLGRIRRHAGD